MTGDNYEWEITLHVLYQVFKKDRNLMMTSQERVFKTNKVD